MPLRDHFRPPVTLRHSWDVLHGGWPMKIVEALQPALPPEYVAGPQVHLGGSVEVDVATFENDRPPAGPWPGNEAGGGTAVAEWPATEPTVRLETDLPDADEYEVRVYDVTRGRRLVAAVELVSPSNKDRPETRRAFVEKCAALVRQGVSVTVVDVVTVREFNLSAELLTVLGPTPADLDPSHIYATTCRGRRPGPRWVVEAWHRPLLLGQPLPALPLWLNDDRAVTLDLEGSYEATCRVLRIG